jgi:hypothetical protein
MDSKTISREHARRIHDALAPSLKYLHRLRRRMEQVGFPLADPLYQLVLTTCNDMQGLTMELHYLSCQGGVGRLRAEEEHKGD